MDSLYDYLLGVLSTPLADNAVARLLEDDKTVEDLQQIFSNWLLSVRSIFPSFSFTHVSFFSSTWVINIDLPLKGVVAFKFITPSDLDSPFSESLDEIRLVHRSSEVDVSVLVVCLYPDDNLSQAYCDFLIKDIGFDSRQFIMMEPQWVASILFEGARPILAEDTSFKLIINEESYILQAGGPSSKSVSVKRTTSSLSTLVGGVLDDPGTYQARIRELRSNADINKTILLCTTFLPPVTHSFEAAQRFYKQFGATDESLRLIQQRGELEIEIWMKHLRNNRRVDIIDRGQLEEYLVAPEYYQMPLARDELLKQVENLAKCLESANYELCLTPEAVSIAYEIRGKEVRVRADRRNKGQPRAGRINGLVLQDSSIAEIFEKEFWSLYRATEPDFKDKDYILNFISERAYRYQGTRTITIDPAPCYDVFISYNSNDRNDALELASTLKSKGIKVWIDQWNLLPGRPWQRALEAEIERISSAIVLISSNGFGPWHKLETEGLIRSFIERDCPVIPVFLESPKSMTEAPLFLRGMHSVSLNCESPDPISEIIRGIRSTRHSGDAQVPYQR